MITNIKKTTKPKLVFFVSEDWYFYSHRLPLAIAAKKEGFDVYLITKKVSHSELIKEHGINVVNLDLNRGKISLISDFLMFIKLIKILQKIKPDIIHNVALKPILYGNIATLILGINSSVSSFAGLGYIFISDTLIARTINFILRVLFRSTLNRNNNRVIFQNMDDLNLMIDKNFISKNITTIIRGSGVDKKQFRYSVENNETRNIVLASRLLWDKGIGEFVKASEIIRNKNYKNIRFIIVGKLDDQNPSSISKRNILHWQEKKLIEWWGFNDDINKVYQQSNIVCLPSYREGLPKSLIEAAACGRAIVTTDVPGCREIVKDKYNGFLVPPKNAKLLAEAILDLINDNSLRNKMGKNGLKYFQNNFTIENIVSQHIKIYRDLSTKNQMNKY